MNIYLRMIGLFFLTNILMTSTTFAQSNAKKSTIKGEEISYTKDGLTMKGYIAYDASKKGKRPGIIVVHEWWGSNEYVRTRARMLASLGYIAMAVDMYGDGKIAEDPKTAGEYATPFIKTQNWQKDALKLPS